MLNIILSCNVVILLFLGNFLWTQRKETLALRDKLDAAEKAIAEVKKDHPILVHADLVFAKQLREVNAQLVSMDNQLQNLENIRENDGGYQHALRILEMGGNREEIVSSCHLSNAEAELLMNLQAYRSAIKV